MVCVIPPNTTFEDVLEVVYTPLFVQFPFTVRVVPGCVTVPFAFIVKLPFATRFFVKVKVVATVPPIVRDLQDAEAFTVGWLSPVKLAFPIITSVAEVGMPAVQFPALFQFVLVFPVQLVCEKLLLKTDNRESSITVIRRYFFIGRY